MIRRTVECYNEEYDKDGYDKNGKYKDQENCKPKVTTAVNKCFRDPPPPSFPGWMIALIVILVLAFCGFVGKYVIYDQFFKDRR
jgi:hypothetical protein